MTFLTHQSSGGSSAREPLHSIVYSSRSASAFTDADLSALLVQCRANNDRLGLTGMLLYRDGRFLQLLEGPGSILDGLMAVITDDDRHRDVRVLLADRPKRRLFASLTMAYRPLADDTAPQESGFRRTFDDLDADVDVDVRATLPALRELIRWFRDQHR